MLLGRKLLRGVLEYKIVYAQAESARPVAFQKQTQHSS